VSRARCPRHKDDDCHDDQSGRKFLSNVFFQLFKIPHDIIIDVMIITTPGFPLLNVINHIHDDNVTRHRREKVLGLTAVGGPTKS